MHPIQLIKSDKGDPTYPVPHLKMRPIRNLWMYIISTHIVLSNFNEFQLPNSDYLFPVSKCIVSRSHTWSFAHGPTRRNTQKKNRSSVCSGGTFITVHVNLVVMRQVPKCISRKRRYSPRLQTAWLQWLWALGRFDFAVGLMTATPNTGGLVLVATSTWRVNFDHEQGGARKCNSWKFWEILKV